jgi:hypothetical protein
MMSDRAKARLLAAGLSLLLSAQVVLILLGALVFFNRVYLGGANAGVGSILGNPLIVIIPPIVGGGGGAATSGAGEGTAPGANPGPGPGEPPPGTAGSQPLLGVTAETNLPILGPRSIPLEVGRSSGDNATVRVPLPRARVTVTVSRHPICDLVKCRSGKAFRTMPGNSAKAAWLRYLKGVEADKPKKKHVPPGQSLEHALERAIHSLLH